MKRSKMPGVWAGAAVLAMVLMVAPVWSQDEQFIPLLVYRTGPYAPNGIPVANGYVDYLKLLNARDGGVNGVTIGWEECETKYNTKLGVECYEKLKNRGETGAALINPYSTGITYQLIPKASVDRLPIHSMGYGRTAAADGRIFKWTFNFPTTYWSQASAFVKYVGQQEGGMEALKGKKIALVYHNSPYGKEPIPTLRILAEKYGYDLKLLAVDHPGQEQKATWLQVRRYRPDWVFMWGWGVMNQVAIKEASLIRYPMDRFIGVWWSGTESDVVPAGDGAIGYKAGNFHGAGADYPVHEAILQHVYGGDAGGRGGQQLRRGAVQPRHHERRVQHRGHPHRHGALRRPADDRRAGALGPGEPGTHHGGPGRPRLGRLHAAAQGHLRGPRGQRPRLHPAVERRDVGHGE